MRRCDPRLWLFSIAVSVTGLNAISVADNGTIITGTVRLNGKIPSVASYKPNHDIAVCGSRARVPQSLLLGANQSVQNVIVYIDKDVPPTKGAPQSRAIILDQRDCEFVPRIQLARSGSPLIIRNSDPILHVVRIEALSATNQPKTLLNIATPYAGYEKRFQLTHFREPTLLRVRCGNGHNWMAAYIAVMPHPWSALTDANGKFTLRELPAGTHKLYAWHEVLGTLTREVKVASSRAVTLDLEFVSAQ